MNNITSASAILRKELLAKILRIYDYFCDEENRKAFAESNYNYGRIARTFQLNGIELEAIMDFVCRYSKENRNESVCKLIADAKEYKEQKDSTKTPRKRTDKNRKYINDKKIDEMEKLFKDIFTDDGSFKDEQKGRLSNGDILVLKEELLEEIDKRLKKIEAKQTVKTQTGFGSNGDNADDMRKEMPSALSIEKIKSKQLKKEIEKRLEKKDEDEDTISDFEEGEQTWEDGERDEKNNVEIDEQLSQAMYSNKVKVLKPKKTTTPKTKKKMSIKMMIGLSLIVVLFVAFIYIIYNVFKTPTPTKKHLQIPTNLMNLQHKPKKTKKPHTILQPKISQKNKNQTLKISNDKQLENIILKEKQKEKIKLKQLEEKNKEQEQLLAIEKAKAEQLKKQREEEAKREAIAKRRKSYTLQDVKHGRIENNSLKINNDIFNVGDIVGIYKVLKIEKDTDSVILYNTVEQYPQRVFVME